MSRLAIITARGGSKRIPRKNIRDFCGKPIIAYSIDAALESGLFDEVMVSTDDDDIAKIARSCGASVPFMRSPNASGDFATTADVVQEVLERYGESGHSFSTFCCIYPTAPFITAEKLRSAYDLFTLGADCVFAVVPFSFPPQRGMVEDGGALFWWHPEHAQTRSQDLQPVYHDAGQFYYRDVSAFLDTGKIIDGRVVGFVVPETEVQDIDNESDWILAEMKFERILSHGQNAG